MKIEIVTHWGGSPASAACADILDCDMFTGHKDSVTCKLCANLIKRSRAKTIRFTVDYNPEKAAWGVYDMKQSKFITSATTRASAGIQRRRMASWYKD